MTWQIFISKNSIWYEPFYTNYLKCSNNFAAYCMSPEKKDVSRCNKSNKKLQIVLKLIKSGWPKSKATVPDIEQKNIFVLDKKNYRNE